MCCVCVCVCACVSVSVCACMHAFEFFKICKLTLVMRRGELRPDTARHARHVRLRERDPVRGPVRCDVPGNDGFLLKFVHIILFAFTTCDVLHIHLHKT